MKTISLLSLRVSPSSTEQKASHVRVSPASWFTGDCQRARRREHRWGGASTRRAAAGHGQNTRSDRALCGSLLVGTFELLTLTLRLLFVHKCYGFACLTVASFIRWMVSAHAAGMFVSGKLVWLVSVLIMCCLCTQKGPMDILVQTIRNEGFFALYKGMCPSCSSIRALKILCRTRHAFTSSGDCWCQQPPLCVIRILQTRDFSLPGPIFEANRHRRRDGWCSKCYSRQPRYAIMLRFFSLAGGLSIRNLWLLVEMFKIRMQGQYGAAGDKRLRDVAKEMWADWGFRKGVMRGYWV
jgi:hypothetical protein